MIYRRTDTYKQDDGEDEVYDYLVNINTEDAIDYSQEAGYMISRFTPVRIDEVSLDGLVGMIEAEMEDNNHHSLGNLANMIREHVEAIAGREVAKQVLWSMINMHGASLGL